MTYKVESGIPIPVTAMDGRTKYPFDNMQLGNSFFVPTADVKKARNLRASFRTKAKGKGMKITTLVDETGIRVWRTA